MLENMENIGARRFQIVYIFVLRALKVTIFAAKDQNLVYCENKLSIITVRMIWKK